MILAYFQELIYYEKGFVLVLDYPKLLAFHIQFLFEIILFQSTQGQRHPRIIVRDSLICVNFNSISADI